MKIISSLLVLLIAVSCKAQESATAVDASAFETGTQNSNVQILDVRTAGEFNSGHLKNALQADWNNKDQFKDRIQYVEKDKPVYIYCLSGGRSSMAAKWMRENGFKSVIELQGGINAWKKENKPLEGVSDVKQMTLEEYKSLIPSGQTVLVDFSATWCPPCVKMAPVIDEIAKENATIKVVKIDGGVHLKIMEELKADALPFFIIYKNGKETWRKQGVAEKTELITQLK